MQSIQKYDVVLIWAGVMSATLWAMLHELDPKLTIWIFESQNTIASESSDVMNNAWTGHSAFCELNYTPQATDGSVDISKALGIVEQFEISKQFRATLTQKWYFSTPHSYINTIPHCSVVFGKEDVQFLKTRYEALQHNHLFHGMEYSEDPAIIATRMPLITKNRDASQPIAATRMSIGTDIDFWSLTRQMLAHLERSDHVHMYGNHRVENLHKESDWLWHITVRDAASKTSRTVRASFVFIWAGGWALPLLQKSGVSERKWFGGFPVSGQRLVCNNPDVIAQHAAKVYGKAALGAPPMSVPHLDTRIINGKKALLFGPYAWFTTKFLKKGSFLDLPLSIKYHNIISMLGAWAHNIPLTKYLIDQVRQSSNDRLDALREYMPDARKEDWDLQEAWYRVQIIKADSKQWWKLQFGTEVIVSADKSLSTLLGASPWASTSVSIMLQIVEKCFPQYRSHLPTIIHSYGQSLHDNSELAATIRKRTHTTLWLA